MYGAVLLVSISDCAAKAASIYPQIIQLLNDSGVPPSDRQKVLSFVMQVVDTDHTGNRVLQ